jgi:hypothetical protein
LGGPCWLITSDLLCLAWAGRWLVWWGGGLLVVGVGVVCVLFESCIVDASIFVVKLLRADGGCLGTRSR